MGRHGGINILHQKSWHVWRLDNRLTVERDELRHAEEEREKRKAVEQSAFTATIRKLRRRAEGKEDEEEPAIEVSAGTSSSSDAQCCPTEEGEKKSRDSKLDASYKYGMVTTSNLKKAELHLDSLLKHKSKGKFPCSGKGKGKDGADSSGTRSRDSAAKGLGSGSHINFFEEAEEEHKRNSEEHQKQLGYTQRNNELTLKSKKAMFSEFDEIASDVPWYIRPRATEEDASEVGASPGQRQIADAGQLTRRSRSRSPPRQRWAERHGQPILKVVSNRKQKSKRQIGADKARRGDRY